MVKQMHDAGCQPQDACSEIKLRMEICLLETNRHRHAATHFPVRSDFFEIQYRCGTYSCAPVALQRASGHSRGPRASRGR
eukprot:9708-Rhodomonas_salina.1